jgi:hypothetical protein
MDPTTTNVEERDQWRARISRALSELQSHAGHIDGRAASDLNDIEVSSDPDTV